MTPSLTLAPHLGHRGLQLSVQRSAVPRPTSTRPVCTATVGGGPSSLPSPRPQQHTAVPFPHKDEAETRLAAQGMLVAQEEEQARLHALGPYLVSPPTRGVVGKSRYAKKLRKEILAAARSAKRAPVLICGEPGLGKGCLAALIHSCSKPQGPLIQVDCNALDNAGTLLFGSGSRRGLLHWLRGGTLLLRNAHTAGPQLLGLLETFAKPDAESCGEQECDRPLPTWRARVMFTSGVPIPSLESLCTVINVPALRVRPSDIKDLQEFVFRGVAKARGLASITVTQEAVRKLQSYSYPLNIRELEGILHRAAAQAVAAGEGPHVMLSEDAFWFASQEKDRYRSDLLKLVPWLRDFLRSKWWMERINYQFTPYAFAVLVAVLFFGPQDRDHNMGLNIVWCWWWPLMFLLFPLLGRVWCAACPFQVYGSLVRLWRVGQGAASLKWPKEEARQWGPWFLLALFGGILMWEEVWDLPNTAYLTGWLLVGITSGAMICSWFFDRRFWCRYLCPIGAMNGTMANLSMTELRARQGVCSSNCSTYTCFKGGAAVGPNGLESAGCPNYAHPAQLEDNRTCLLCMECLKACSHQSVELRLRVPGIDLWTSHKPSTPEACLMFMLLGSAALHHLPQLLTQLGLPSAVLSDTRNHLLASALVLSAPGLLCFVADWGWQRMRAADDGFGLHLLGVGAEAQKLVPAGGPLALDAMRGSDSGRGQAGAALAAPAVPRVYAQTGAVTAKSFEACGSKCGKCGPAVAASTTSPAPAPALASTGTPGCGCGGSCNCSSSGGSAAAGGQAGAGNTQLAAGGSARQDPPREAPPRSPQPFLHRCYGFLPLTWAAILSHYLEPMLSEGGSLLQATASTFGLPSDGLPHSAVHPAVTSFLQGATLLVGCVLSLALTRKIGEAHPLREQLAQMVLSVALAAELWSLVVGH